MSDDFDAEEYREAMEASHQKYVPPRQIHQWEWMKISHALTEVEESEADAGRPIGNHYKLAKVLREILGVVVNKENMKEIARDVLDYAYIPD